MLLKDAAKQDAESILRAYWPTGTFPVNLEGIAGMMDISVHRRDLPEDTSGVIVKRLGQDAEILLEATDSQVRRNFTCAHEIGRYVERTSRGGDEEFGFVDL